MSPIHTLTSFGLACTLALVSVGASAQTDADHTKHHPQAGADSSMKTMHEMHTKMMAAKTPEERKALMADHMKAMQDGMAMMDKMKNMPGRDGKPMDMASHHTMMEKRMDMMTSMMKMMMDRLPETPAK
ncbi:MAG: hypothetical protein V4858_11355 [Pseudomonadota bacterium]